MELSKGFSLVELLIVAGLTAVVLAGLGALTLVSDLQVGRRSNSLQEAQEQWGRAVAFIQNEAGDGASLSGSLSDDDVCNGIATASFEVNGIDTYPTLVIKGPNTPPNWTIIYGVRNLNELDENIRVLYRGPKLLIRCGPFPINDSSTQSQTVLLDRLPDGNDRLPDGNPFQVQLLPNPVSGQPAQDAIVTITLKTGTNTTYASDQPFRVHAQRSPQLTP
jgi:type II secretory pathway pseudopilin PulG